MNSWHAAVWFERNKNKTKNKTKERSEAETGHNISRHYMAEAEEPPAHLRPDWMPNNASIHCLVCKTPFSFTLRRVNLPILLLIFF
jgi:hypothetical protein